MSTPRTSLIFLSTLLILAFTFSTALAGSEPPVADSEVNLAADPNPISPIGLIYDNTPTFKFTPYLSVSKYKITVTRPDDSLVYIFKGDADCSPTECSLTPTTPLTGKYGLVMRKGEYRWTVQAKTGPGAWTPPQVPAKAFAIVTTGFESTFTNDRKHWQDMNGTWTWLTKGQLLNIGTVNEYASVAHQYYIVGDYTYEAKIKLKSEHTYLTTDLEHQAGGIIVEGAPNQRIARQIWYNGVYVLIRNDRQACIYEFWNGDFVDSTAVCETVAAIKPNEWNTIKVTVVGNNMLVKINDVDWRSYTDSEHSIFTYGAFVGLTHFRFATEIEKMLVDRVKLEILNVP